MLKDYFKYAIGNLRKRKLRSWLTLIGIFIGIAAVVALIGLGDGLKNAISSQFGISTTEVLTIQASGFTGAGPPGSGVVRPLTLDDVDAIKSLSLIQSSIPRNIESGKIEYNDRLVFGILFSIPDGEDRKFSYETLDLELEEGRLLRDGDVDRVVLGYNFHTPDFGFDESINAGDTITIQGEKFEVVGIIKKKGSFIFDNAVQMNEEPLRDLFNTGEDVDVIVARVKSKEYLEEAKLDVEKLLRKRRDVKMGEEDFTVQTPESALETVNQVLTGVQIFIAIIAGISILVGAIGIINTMLTAVMERKKQIGIMKAIGAKNSDIFLLFLIESGTLGLVGGFIGVILGTLMSFFGTIGINSLIGAEAAPQINFILIISALIGGFLIGAIAGIIPALRAARQEPVDALRG